MPNFVFETGLFDKFLPAYFHTNDSYKDMYGQGIVERFLAAMGQELDEQVYPKIGEVLELYDAINTPEKFIAHLSEMLGSLPSTFYYDDYYRLFLKHVADINRLKGTAAGYELLFKCLGVTCEVVEIEPDSKLYDDGLLYDDGEIYDQNCNVCSEYQLVFTDPLGNCPELGSIPGSDDYLILEQLIKYNEPINAVLTQITYNGSIVVKLGSYASSYASSYKRFK